MADRKRRFTQKIVDALPPGDAGGTWWSDSEQEGLYLVRYAGAKSVYKVRIRINGRRRVVKVGRADRITLTMARERARHLLAQAELGRDPAAEKERARKMPTWRSWTKTYLERVAMKKKSPREDVRFLGPASASVRAWGTRPLDEIGREDVERLHVALKKTPTGANRALASVRACLSAAVRAGHVAVNPARGITHFRESPPRDRVLSDEEMGRLRRALAAEDAFDRAAFAMLILTGARLSEALHARWADLDLKAGTWRIPSPKTGRPQVVPLPAAIVEILTGLPHVGPYVIPGRDKDRPRYDLQGPWKRVRDAAELEGVRIHDIRRTFGLAVTRISGLLVASKLLRHSNVMVTERVYAPLGMAELRAATEQRAASLPAAAEES
ncbi:MAG: site-specific integrase [Thermoanaerobaculia bacterium]